jgi:hypothetical protein
LDLGINEVHIRVWNTLFRVNELIVLVDTPLLESDRFPGYESNGPAITSKVLQFSRRGPSHTTSRAPRWDLINNSWKV